MAASKTRTWIVDLEPKKPGSVASSKVWIQTLDLNSEKDGPWKSWMTKKLDLEKPEYWKNLDAEKPGHWNTFTGQKLDAEKLLQDHIV